MLQKFKTLTMINVLLLSSYIFSEQVPEPATQLFTFNSISTQWPMPAKEEFKKFTGQVCKNKVRLRIAPKLDSLIIKEVNTGTLLEVIGEDKDFFIIKPTEDIKGYIFSSLSKDGIITSELVNVRINPSTDASIITKLRRHEHVDIFQPVNEGQWLEIALPCNTLLYISKKFVNNIGDTSVISQYKQNQAEAKEQLATALSYAEQELVKPLDKVNIELIYQKINSIHDLNKNDPSIKLIIDQALLQVQNQYFNKIEEQKHTPQKSEEIQSIPLSKLSQKIKKIPSKKISTHYNIQQNYLSSEESLFTLWKSLLNNNVDSKISISDFYSSELNHSTTIRGVLHKYSHITNMAPGNFVIKQGNRTIAFIYSTLIDMSKYEGKEVSISASNRNNNFFAFPALFALNIEEIPS